MPPDFEFKHSFKLCLNVTEVCEHYPSFEAEIEVTCGAEGKFSFHQPGVQIECGVWDAFGEGLASLKQGESELIAVLCDMSGTGSREPIVSLEVTRQGSGYRAELTCRQCSNLHSDPAAISLHCAVDLSANELEQLQEAVRDFPKWW